ncbi:MAG: GldG family protein [Verrucomicrobia bacterium]|nr:GldG family protein [Verrucomicrobiota bacterium]
MANDTSTKPSFSAGRKWTIGFNVVVASLAVLALVVMVNYLGVRHYWRFQFSDRGQMKLSPQTVNVLRSLTNEVAVTVFFDAQGEEELYSLVSSLLKEYNYLNPAISIKTVDPMRQPGKAQLVLAEHKLTNPKDKNFIIFYCAGHQRIVYQNELSDYDLQAVISGKSKEFKRIGFTGEMLFTAAIFNVANPRTYKAYFLQGHREHNPELTGEPHGYAKFAALLKEENNIQPERFSLQGTNEVPMDCQLLIIAGPRIPLSDSELERIENYLKQGGRLFALLNNMALGKRSGLEKILAKWGVDVADNMVFDPKNSPTGSDLLTARLSDQHPVVKSLVPDALRIRLILPRAVGRLETGVPKVDAPKVDLLAATSEGGTEATEIRGGVPYLNPYRGQQATNFPLIVAVEQGGIKNVTDHGTTRMVVVGDSLCLDNEIIDSVPGNYYFASQAVNWLLERPQILLSGLGPRPLKEYKLIMTDSQRQSVQWLLLAGMPGAVLLLGGLVWLRRRR